MIESNIPLHGQEFPAKAPHESSNEQTSSAIDHSGLTGIRGIFQDAKINSPKVKCFLVVFRIASAFERKKTSMFYRALYYLANAAYCLFSDLFMGGAELPAGTSVGRNLTIHHGYGLVVGKDSRIMDNVTLRQGVTIGNYVDRSGQIVGDPVIESGVEFGAGACALGNLTIGEGAFIGANCVVYRDVPAGARVYPGHCTVQSIE